MKNSMSILFKNLSGITALFKHHITNTNAFDVARMI